MTLIVNLFAGPGVGKSTTAALVFGQLKDRDVNAELITEYAKELVYEGRDIYQPYVMGKQWFRMKRLEGKVDVAVSDSPIMLTAVYGRDLGQKWLDCVHMLFSQFNSLNIYLERNNEEFPYKEHGRYQNYEQALEVDKVIEDALTEYHIPHIRVPVMEAKDRVTDVVMRYLEIKQDVENVLAHEFLGNYYKEEEHVRKVH